MKPIRYFFSWLFALIAALILTISAFAIPAVRALTTPELHHRIATNPAVIQSQQAYIESALQSLVEQYQFSIETVTGQITDEQLAAYNLQVSDWWQGFFRQEKPSLTIPEFRLDSLSELLTADEGLAAAVGKRRLKTTISDTIIPTVQAAVKKAVFPMQDSVLSLGLSKVLKRVDVPKLFSLLPLLYVALPGAGLLMLLLSMLFSFRLPWCSRAFAGSTFWSAALMVTAVMLLFHFSGAMTALQTASPRLALQFSMLLKESSTTLYCIDVGYALIGTGLFILTPRRHG